jgi:hypothetical protein
MTTDVATTHDAIQKKRKGMPNTSGRTRLAKRIPPSIPTVGRKPSQ